MLALAAGLAWIAFLEPAWPGCLLAALAAATAIRGWRRPRQDAVEPPAVIDIGTATTIYRPQR